MMLGTEKTFDLETMLLNQWSGQIAPHPGLLEQRVLEMEGLGMTDTEDMPGVPSSTRQYAIASLQHTKPAYFITYDEDLLAMRDVIEPRYGLTILSIQEAALLLRDTHEPPN